jgi:hypothetical protein
MIFCKIFYFSVELCFGLHLFIAKPHWACQINWEPFNSCSAILDIRSSNLDFIFLLLYFCCDVIIYRVSYGEAREALLEGRLNTVDLLVLTSLDQLIFILKILFTCFTQQATLMRRSTVLSLPLQLVFPGEAFQS